MGCHKGFAQVKLEAYLKVGWCFFCKILQYIPSLKLTYPLKIGRNPNGSLPTIDFQVRLLLVSGRVGDGFACGYRHFTGIGRF